MASMQAHIAVHVGYAYRSKIEVALGVALPDTEDEMPESMEREISKLMAQAATQVLTESKAVVAQQQAQQNAQDPIVQMQMQELQIKKQDADTKAKKVMIDAQAKMGELELKKAELQSRQQESGVKLATQSAKDKAKLDQETIRMGADFGLKKAQMMHQQRQPPKGNK
jgi:hypothetical protein